MMNPRDDRAGVSAPKEANRREAPFQPAAPPLLSLPKSGGALRSIGESFKAGGPTGTGTLRVPLPISPCRGGKEPAIALTYDSGKGHSEFGIGWSADLPSITRRTDRGMPKYFDAEESDIFVLSGQEDLVPVLTATVGPTGTTTWTRTPTTDGIYRVDAYRPRVEGLFARIERRTNTQTGDVHWRSITADNVTSVFGLSPSSRIADPQNPRHVFKWCLEATFDDRGHATVFDYKQEDTTGVSPSDLSEATRINKPQANIYPKVVRYGNAMPLATRNPLRADLDALTYFFELVFDYGEHKTSLPVEVAPWALRPDPASTYRGGFEVRTYRLCQRVLMFHALAALGSQPLLVKSLDLKYDASPTVTYLTQARLTGYAPDPSGMTATASMPAMRFDYSRVGALSTTVRAVDADSRMGAPVGVDGTQYQLVDLDGEGIAGVLSATAPPSPALQYKRNLGCGRLGRPQTLSLQPSMQSLGPGVRLVSVNADGRLDVAQLEGPMPGFFERNEEFGWDSYRTFGSMPRLDLSRRGVHLLDVDGDGLTDILVAESDGSTWYPSLSRAGYGAPRRRMHEVGTVSSPPLFTTEDYETTFLADMSGDGLLDVVQVRNGSVIYWPNRGYGRFGDPVRMKSAPLFDTPDLFDPRRVRFGDIDGTGTTDIVYLGRSGATVYFNQAGNGWSGGTLIPIPTANALTNVRLADFLGTGTACLVWSSSSPADTASPFRYVDLLQSTKPHLLVNVHNGFGAETRITFAPSTRFYLEDRAAGRPWATRLPFVVQTVARVEAIDHVSGARRVSHYRYAHGFYDGVEREFRGFARVDHWDADFLTDAHGAGVAPGAIDDANGEYALPPIHTIQWIHTGAWGETLGDLRTVLAKEFYAGAALAPPLPGNNLPSGLGTNDAREAHRALKGRVLREEVYADDGTALASVPYVVTDHTHEVRQLQPIANQRHGVYHPCAREDVLLHYERNAADPRIEHTLTLEVDPIGHVVRQAHIGYARRSAAQPEQAVLLATCKLSTYAPPLLTAPYDYRHGVPTEAKSYELILPTSSSVVPFASVDSAMTSASVVPFTTAASAGSMRLIEDVQHSYYFDDLSGVAASGTALTLALVYDHSALALPAALVTSVFGVSLNPTELTGACGCIPLGSDYGSHAGVTTYDAAHFYQPTTFTDPFGNISSVLYDSERLFIVEEHTSQNPAFDNPTTAVIDYRVLAPSLITDANGNQIAASFDPLGMVNATAVLGNLSAPAGNPNLVSGDTLASSTPSDPGPPTGDGPTTRIVYNLTAWEQTPPAPASVQTFARLQHGALNAGWFSTVSYSDGSGREVLTKVQAEPATPGGRPRWVGTGRTVFDNKGNPVKKYEPYFADDASYDTEASLVMSGYSQILRYDPLSRLVRTDFPDGTFATVVVGAWQESRFDANDNVLTSAWYANATSLPSTDPLNRASTLAAACANTPEVRSFDALGRTFLSVADNGGGVTFPTRSKLDIQGNAVAVTDANGVVTLQQTFDPLGRVLMTVSVDAGTSSALDDVVGKPYRSWDPRGYQHTTSYDALHRPTQIWVTPPSGTVFLAECLVYGEGVTDSTGAVLPNCRGHLYQHFDGAGVLTNQAYDFENRVTQTTRQLSPNYTATPDWSVIASTSTPTGFLSAATSAGLLSVADTFDTYTTFDALGRVLTLQTPDKSITTMTYGDGSLLATVSTNVRGASSATPVVTQIAYNAMRQRIGVTSGGGVNVAYTYDGRTHVIMRVYTTPAAGGAPLQDLNYTYDPVHNVVQVTDNTQPTVYFAGNVTSGTQQFLYDPTYRLTQATGREQPGQVGWTPGLYGYPEAPPATINPNDAAAMLAYTEAYAYDPVGNLQQTKHSSGGTTWVRTQSYAPGTNRLANFSMSGPATGTVAHDSAGNITSLPNVSSMTWDHAGRLASANLGGGGMAYFTYDSAGNRVRKVIVQVGPILDRVYVGEFERYRQVSGTALATGTVALERQTLHVHDGERRFALLDTTTVDTSVAGFSATTLPRFQFPNHVGSAALETDGTGSVISYEEYFPFGGSSFQARIGGIDKRYRFAAKERDEETGLYYFGARYYAPWLARWTRPDPSGHVDGPNLYAYSRNNPTSLTDTNGLETTIPLYERAAIAALEGLAWLMGESAANAPTSKETPRFDRVSDAEFAARVGLTVASGGVGSAVTKRALGGATARLFASGTQRAVAAGVGGATSGAVQGVGSVAINDASRGNVSSVGTYVKAGVTGAVVGGVLAGGVSAARTTLARASASPATPPGVRQRAVGTTTPSSETGGVSAPAPAGGTVGRPVTYTYGNLGGKAYGVTDKFGNITIQQGLPPALEAEVIRHESVHAFLSPGPGQLQALRAGLLDVGYQRSALLRYTEEAMAQGYATRSLTAGLAFPITHGYVTPLRLGVEAAVVGGATAAGVAGARELLK